MLEWQVRDEKFLPHHGCDVSLKLKEGECLALTGENGIGKSTLLQRLYQQIPAEKRSVVEQKTAEYFFDRPLRTIKDHFLKANLPGFQAPIFLRLWKELQFEGKEERLISHLSGGEGQSLKIILALSKAAEVYLLDEPSQYLDSQRKEILAKELERLCSEGKSVVLVEHDQTWFKKGWQIQELIVQENRLQVGKQWTT